MVILDGSVRAEGMRRADSGASELPGHHRHDRIFGGRSFAEIGDPVPAGTVRRRQHLTAGAVSAVPTALTVTAEGRFLTGPGDGRILEMLGRVAIHQIHLHKWLPP
ncbi:hypothetical protein [Streptomyces yangpuensis]|uniref:hypothetical protein n=1 Tax=Streptomyces yangpuensis TaxID=1648182 RepID=UPI0035DDFCBA